VKRKFKGGLTSVSLPVFIADTSSTTGGGLSGVTSASSGLVLEYRRAGQSTWTSVTPQAGKTLGSYLSGGIVADGSLAGAYEVDFPDAAFASGARMVVCRVRGVTNMLAVLIEIELDAVDYQVDAFGAIKPTTAGRTLDVSAGGEAGIDLANVGSPTTTVNLSGVTIKTATDVETDTQDIQNRLPAALVDGRIVALAQAVGDKTGYTATISDKTGFKLASDGLALVTAWTVGITGNLTGNVTGSVGSISGVSFPANFSLLGIGGTGAILLVDTVDELAAGALTANGAVDSIPPAVWNASTTDTYVDGSFGDRSLISKNNTREVAVTGSNHVAAVLHDAEPNSIPEDAFVTGALSARALAADAATEIAAEVGALQVLTRLNSMIEDNGAGQFRFDTIALEMAPAGGGGGGTDWTANERSAIRAILGVPASGTTPTDPAVGILDEIRDSIGTIGINVYPVSASTPERVQGTTLTFYRDESRSVSVVTDFTLTSLTLQFTVEDSEGTDLLTIANASISRSDKTFTVSIGTAVTATISNYRWALRDITGGSNSVIARGVLSVQEAASNG
jgi:hypothetical protein